MFKNQLQELAQRSCYNMPSYSCIKEGPDHAPKFKASVNFNGEVFDSPGYFPTLRHAEHAAAEIALKGIQTRLSNPSCLAKILDESGVCKNLLQENAQRASVPLPVYNTRKSGPGHQPVFTCTVEVAAMQFTGDAAKTKKQAEKNAALSAWSALRKKAGRTTCAPVEDSDVTDEQEQKLIADILRNNLSDKQPIKSSPAALAENHHHRAGISPALLPSTPLYTRRSVADSSVLDPSLGLPASIPGHTSMPAGNTGPLYQRHHGRGVAEDRSTVAAIPAGGPVYKPRHINASWVRQQEGDNPNPTRPGPSQRDVRPQQSYSGPSYTPRQVHSSPHVNSQMMCSMPADMARVNHSMPTFPTQPLLSHAIPSMPGVGIPGHSVTMVQPLTATASHNGMANRSGMAYQPRFMKQFQGGVPTPVGGVNRPAGAGAGADPTWSPASQHVDSRLNAAGNSMWREQIPGSLPGAQWNTQMNSCRPVMGSGAQMCVGVPTVMSTGGRVGNTEDDDDTPEAQQVEHTTRLMLSHLCLE